MLEPVNILIVEDDPPIRRMYQSALERSGYRVSLAASGEEALAYLQLITPDIILLDLNLPGINGHEVARRIKADRTKPFTPVIILSATDDSATSIASLDAGADDFLAKPIEIAELLARIRAMLRLQRAQRGLQTEQVKTELLLHLTRDLGASIDLDVLLTRFLDHLADAVGAIRASMILTEFDEDRLLLFSSSRNQAGPQLQTIVRQGVAGWVLREGESLIIQDTRQDARWFAVTEVHSNVRAVAAMPVQREGRMLGVITLVHHTPGYFTEDHVELLSSVAAQSAVALESAQLFRLTQRQKELLSRRAEELRKINEINALLSELMQPDQLVRLLVYMIHQQFEYPLVSLLLREEQSLILRASAGTFADPSEPLRVAADAGLIGWALSHQQIVLVNDVRHDPRFAPMLPHDDKVASMLVVPIVLRRTALGALVVRSPQVGVFGSNDEAVLGAIVSQFSIALGNAQLLENEQQRIQQLNQVNRLSVAITAQLDAPQNLQVAADTVAHIFGVRHAALLLFGEEDQHGQMLVAFSGEHAPNDAEMARFLFDTPAVMQYLRDLRAPRVYTQLAAEAAMQPLRRLIDYLELSALLIVPLRAGPRTLGALLIDATQRSEGFDRADLELATTVSSLIVQVIENARLYRVVADERSTLDAVLRGANDPILLVGPDRELLLANRAAEERMFIRLERDRGRSIAVLAQANGSILLDRLAPLLGRAEPVQGDSEISADSAGETVYSVSIASVDGADGLPLGQVTVLRDISAIKRLERQERERVRSVFRRYVSPQVAEQLLSAGSDFGAPTERDVAVIFADMRGFTTLTERTQARVLIESILNRYFTAMTETLYAYDGTIDKFLGDGVIGVFGSPIGHPDDPQRALAAAAAMQRAFGKLACDWRTELNLEIGMGIGLSYGRAVVGNIGSTQRQDYTLIGDVVNTASRLSGLAQPGQVIASYHLYEALPPEWIGRGQLHPLGEVKIKGKQEPHLIYDLRYGGDEA